MRSEIQQRIACADDPAEHKISWEGRLGVTQENARPHECELELAASVSATIPKKIIVFQNVAK